MKAQILTIRIIVVFLLIGLIYCFRGLPYTSTMNSAKSVYHSLTAIAHSPQPPPPTSAARALPPSVSTEIEPAADLYSLASWYNHQPRQDLKKDFEVSVSASKELLKKANAGTLTENEKSILTLEIRRQAVINNLLIQSQIETLKRKYL